MCIIPVTEILSKMWCYLQLHKLDIANFCVSWIFSVLFYGARALFGLGFFIDINGTG